MSKLPKEHSFLDLSDYGRPLARLIANSLKDTKFNAIHVTCAFIICGLIAAFSIVKGYHWAAAFFLIFKSVLDAADGELARLQNKPSYVGRYFDSIADIILNAIFCFTIFYTTESFLSSTLLAFIGIQLQGTLYNYYYVILRNKFNGDTTSRIFENEAPLAMKGEKQNQVNFFFKTYKIFYGIFDKAIYLLDPKAQEGKGLPKCFMTAVSAFGLGFQLLLISIFLILGWKEIILPFFILYSLLIILFIGIRRIFF